jgi:rubrerythrin
MILKFAENLENCDIRFFDSAAQNPDCRDYQELFKGFSKDAKKNIQNLQRIRRENVTEMILESISGFHEDDFSFACEDAGGMTNRDALETAQRLEKRAEDFYLSAAAALKAQPEVARGLKTIAKKHAAHLKKI